MGVGGSAGLVSREAIRTQVCVIGAGAAGLTIAQRLDRSGVDVVVVEAGGEHRDRSVEARDFTVEELGEPLRNPEPSRGRWFGGSTNLWFGRIAMLRPIDFVHRTWVPHSGWPIGREDLQPWVEVAADVLDVANPQCMDVARWGRNATLDAFHGKPDTDITVFMWSRQPELGRVLRPSLERSPNVRIVLDSTVTAIVANESSRAVEEVVVARPDGLSFSVRADHVVLAAGGLENPRLLLASTTRSERGLGNEHDLVGRYYMDHPRGEGLAELDLHGCDAGQLASLHFLGERTPSAYGDVQLGVTFSERKQRQGELLDHAVHAHLVSDAHTSDGYRAARRLAQRVRNQAGDISPIGQDVAAVIKGTPDLARLAIGKLTRRMKPARAIFIDQMEQEPDPQSRVTVDHRRPDRFGLPQLCLDWRIGSSTRRSQAAMHAMLRDQLAEFGMTGFHSAVLS
ncbi:MAG: FAD-dependent oxidoreductase, partial [Ilumatobacteraceae bacterium]